jgi:hypothetical protein
LAKVRLENQAFGIDGLNCASLFHDGSPSFRAMLSALRLGGTPDIGRYLQRAHDPDQRNQLKLRPSDIPVGPIAPQQDRQHLGRLAGLPLVPTLAGELAARRRKRSLPMRNSERSPRLSHERCPVDARRIADDV